MRTHKLTLSLLGMFACYAITAVSVFAQGAQPWNVVSGDWNTNSNWLLQLLPDAAFGETALIANGGTAMLTSAATFSVGGFAMGPGALELTSSGSLTVVDASGVDASATGFFSVGNGDLTLADNASVTVVGAVILNGHTNVSGPNVTFTTQSNLSFGASSVYNADISNATTHSAFTAATGAVNLGGTLNVVFSGGVSPTLGDVWTLADATTINGNFGAINVSGATLSSGQAFGVTQVAGGSGTLAQLVIQERLVLQVDRQTGATTLRNPGTIPISFQGYSVESAVGLLDPSDSGWNSLEDQAVANWFEVTSTANGLGELENSVGGSHTIAAAGGQQLLGNAFATPLPPFATLSPEDLVFKYRDATDGVVAGLVEYVGDVQLNNLVLTVDSSTGNAEIRNASPSISVDLEAYTITSVAGSLLTAFESDLPNAEWAETAGSANGIGELNFTTGATTLAPSDTFSLTGLFSSGGAQDLVLEFRIKPFGEGDFNGDGLVDSADLVQWEGDFGVNGDSDADSDGDSDGSDFLAWQRGFGDAAGSGILTGFVEYDGSFPLMQNIAAVPEPSSLLLVGIIGIAGLMVVGRKRMVSQPM